jgi:predicted membrane protein
MLLIVIGLVITLGSSGEKTSGVIVMAIGAFFLVPKIFSYAFDINIFWPAIFIVVGIIFICSRRIRIKGHSEARIGDNFIDIVNIFSGSEKQIMSENFKGGQITSIFGGSEIDLRKAKLAPEVSELEITCVFGGVSIIVPSDWYVKVEVTPVFGGVEEQKIASDKFVDMSKQLVIKGTVVFGGAEIKRY